METDALTPDVPCDIVPRHDATSDGLKLLGLALAQWSQEELRPGGLLRHIDNIVLAELLGGDDPSDLVFALVHGEEEGECLTVRRCGLPHSNPTEAARRLVVACSFSGPGYSRQQAIDSLREGVPSGLVEDVLLDGRSWDLL